MTQDPFEAHLQRAEESFRDGDPQRAGQIWQAILKRVPDHPVARQGLLRVKQALEKASAPPPKLSPEEVDTLLRQASQLWDLGVPDDAIEKWEKVLAHDPKNEEARAFITMVKKEQAEAAAKPPKPPPQAPALFAAPSPEPSPQYAPRPAPAPILEGMTTTLPTMVHEGEDPRIMQGEHLLALERFDEATYAFEQALLHQPGNKRAQAGLVLAQNGGVAPLPAAVTAPASARRLGLEIPAPLRELAAHPWVQSPVVWACTLGGMVVVTVGLSYWRQAAKDRQLRADVSRAIQESLEPVRRASVVIDLNESAGTILAEAKSVLSEDPLRAYHRAKLALRLAPQDAAAAQILEKARTALAEGGSLLDGNGDAKVQPGDVDGALEALLAQLRSSPEDPTLLRKASSLLGLRAQMQATKGDLGAAKESLKRARAFTPEDRTWNARLHLIDHIQSQPKAEQAGWLALLG